MTKARDIRELIAEQNPSPADQKALEAVADRLDKVLAQEVPYRPEFKAELRKQLIAQARRQTPVAWYRRPAVWGTAAAMAAAVGIIAVGLRLWSGQDGLGGTKQPPVATAPAGEGPGVIPHLVAASPLPAIPPWDEVLPAGFAGPAATPTDVTAGLMTYKISAAPDQALVDRIARGLGFTQKSADGGPAGWTVTQGARTLNLMADGHLLYVDPSPATGGTKVDPANAEAAARQFLQRASLAIPSQPTTMEGTEGGRHLFKVTYTPRIGAGQLPVVNARTEVKVSDQGTVVGAEAYLLGGETENKAYTALPAATALQTAQDQGGGSFSGLDLVYVRTPDSGMVYLQPVWRVFGTNPNGLRFVRYLPALVKQ